MPDLTRPAGTWTLLKGETRIDCLFEFDGPPYPVFWVINRQWCFRSIFADRASASAAANHKYEELRAAEWTTGRDTGAREDAVNTP
jgi:hypothetical protein